MFNLKSVYLRPLEFVDLESRVSWFNDPDINQYLVSDFPMSLAGTQAWYAKACTDASKFNLSICDIDSGKLIGMTGLIEIDQKNAKAQFYMTIGDPAFRGLRLPDQIIPAVIGYGFSYLRLNKIYLWTLENNVRARKVYERNGFLYEATLRQHLHCRGSYQNIIQHSVFR